MNDAVPAFRQVAQDLELPMGQVKRIRIAPRGVGFEVDFDVTQPDTRDHEHGPPQHRIDSRRQLLHVERLGDVVIGARFQPQDGVRLGVERGQHDDRDHVAPPPKRATDLVYVGSRA